jgi:hypothetical protein
VKHFNMLDIKLLNLTINNRRNNDIHHTQFHLPPDWQQPPFYAIVTQTTFFIYESLQPLLKATVYSVLCINLAGLTPPWVLSLCLWILRNVVVVLESSTFMFCSFILLFSFCGCLVTVTYSSYHATGCGLNIWFYYTVPIGTYLVYVKY